MRTILSASAAALSLIAFTSCSSVELTKADIKTFKLRDLTRFGQPTIVKISPKDLEMMDLTKDELTAVNAQQQRYQKQLANQVTGPIDFDPPSLPDAGILYDGSILPPKNKGKGKGTTAVLDVQGSIPSDSATTLDNPEKFSIE